MNRLITFARLRALGFTKARGGFRLLSRGYEFTIQKVDGVKHTWEFSLSSATKPFLRHVTHMDELLGCVAEDCEYHGRQSLAADFKRLLDNP